VAAPVEADPAVTAEIRRKTALAFGRLPPKLRIAATLAVIEEQPQKDVAAALGISVAAVKVRVFRALRLLRKDLEKQGISHECKRSGPHKEAIAAVAAAGETATRGRDAICGPTCCGGWTRSCANQPRPAGPGSTGHCWPACGSSSRFFRRRFPCFSTTCEPADACPPTYLQTRRKL
jgi:hypothetical protein